MKVYLAGRIDRERERWGLVDWNLPIDRELPFSSYTSQVPPVSFKVRATDKISFTYMGPFVGGSCDHACAHDWPHAAGPTCMNAPQIDVPDGVAEAAIRSGVVMRDLAAIKASDAVFAYINSADCHGTLAEIGYAAGCGVQIFVGFSTNELAEELWFPRLLANQSWVGLTDGAQLFELAAIDALRGAQFVMVSATDPALATLPPLRRLTGVARTRAA